MSAGEPPVGSAPSLIRRAVPSADLMNLSVEALSLAMISFGVFAGGLRYGEPGRGGVVAVRTAGFQRWIGMSFIGSQRLLVETASARIWLLSAKGCAAGRLSIITWTRPPIRSVSAGALPL